MNERQITSDNDLFNLLEYLIQNKLSKVNTILPCKIVKIKDENTIDVQSLIKIVWEDGTQEEPPVISNVIVSKLIGGNCIIDVELKTGDLGIVGFCQQDISASVKNKGIETPNTKRQFSLSDGVWLGGILNKGNESNKIFLSQNGEIEIKSNSKIVLSAGNQSLGEIIEKLTEIINGIMTMSIPTPSGATTPIVSVNPKLLVDLNQVKTLLNNFK